MINILIPITEDDKKYQKLLSNLLGGDIRVYIGVTEELKDVYLPFENELRSIYVFKNGSDKEAIINSLYAYVEEGSVMIVRKPLKAAELNKFIMEKKDIVVCQKKRSSISKFILLIWQKILRFVLGVNLYPGSTSVVYFSENISPILRETNNLSYASRIDRWRGVEKSVVDANCEEVKYKVDKKALATNIIFMCDLLFIAVAITALVSIFTKISIIGGILLFCLDALCLTIIVILLVMTIFNSMVGPRNVGYAMEETEEYFLEDIENE